MTEEQALEQFEKEAESIFNLRQSLPEELYLMVQGWSVQFADYANRQQLQTTSAACAVAIMMAMVVQTHTDAAMADGQSYDQAINQMLHFLDVAARVELGIKLHDAKSAPKH